ncbi:MAG: hypothetical protein WCT45_02170 [Candidatus Paceibacterota bacterium]|jgi:hypothetical protein
MFDFLPWRKAKGTPPAPKDLWEGSTGYYIASLRWDIDNLAEELSRHGCFVTAYFNREQGCAELTTSKGEVLARIHATGESGCPADKATVIFSILFPENLKALFRSLMPKLHSLELKEAHAPL